MYIIPLILHLYDVIVGFGLGIRQSYVSVVVFTVLHMAFLYAIYRRRKKPA